MDMISISVMHGDRRLLGVGLFIRDSRLGFLSLSFLYPLLGKVLYGMGWDGTEWDGRMKLKRGLTEWRLSR